MKILYFLVIALGLISCSKGDQATYEVDPNYKKLDEAQFVESAASKDLSPRQMQSSFSYKKYYELLDEKTDQDLSETQLLKLGKTLGFHCSEDTIDIQLDIFRKLIHNSSNPKFRNQILGYEKSFINKCPSISEIQLKKLKRIHSFITKLSQKEMMNSLELVIELDQLIASKVLGIQSFSSFNALEINDMILIMANTSSLKEINQLIKLHKRLSPLSKNKRSELIKKSFNGPNAIAIIKNSEFDTVSEFLLEYFETNSEYNQNRLKEIIKVLRNKIAKKYENITRFEDIEEVLSYAWEDYLNLYRILNADKIDDKRFVINEFGRLNLIIEKIYELPLNRTPAIDFLESTNGEDTRLALFHLMRLKTSQERAELYNDYKEILSSDTIYNNIIDKLLSLRISIYDKKNAENNIKTYCEFLNTKQFNQNNYKRINNIQGTINNLNTFGCFELRSFENTLTQAQIAEDTKYELNLNIGNIQSPVDMLIRANDSNISINTDYYNGPVWYLPTKRTHNHRENIDVDLDARASIIAINVNLSNNDGSDFSSDTLKLFYNYDLKRALPPLLAAEYLGDIPLKRGFKGGDLKVNVKSSKSIRPLVINIGGIGQKGPDTIKVGKGIDINRVMTDLFSGTNSETLAAQIYTDTTVTFPNLQTATVKKLKKYAFDVVVDKELTSLIHDDLCAGLSKSSPRDICYIVGDHYEYRKLDNNQLNFLNQTADNDLKHAISILANESLATQYIGERFNIPPSSESAKGSDTEFGYGNFGKTGRVDFKILD